MEYSIVLYTIPYYKNIGFDTKIKIKNEKVMVKLCFNDYSVLMMFMSFRSAVACFCTYNPAFSEY